MSVVYPGLQTQLKEPSVFKHCPFLHRFPITLHSSISAERAHRSSTEPHTRISTNTRAGGVTLAVGGVSGAQRAHLLVVCGPGQRAELTVGPPAAAPVTTALRFSDADATAWTHLTHGLQNLQEAEALPVIWHTHTQTHRHTRLFLWIVGSFHTLLLLLFWPNNIFYLLTLNLQKTCFNLDFHFDGWPWIVLCVYDTRLV